MHSISHALALRDLTDPSEGEHAMQLVLDAIHAALPVPVQLHRTPRIVRVADNYDRLGYPPDGAARDARYTRYVSADEVLRSQMSAAIPPLLRQPLPDDVVLSCPGIVYRRDAIDRLHTGEPHQVDLWRIARGELGVADLHAMIAAVVGAALPGATWRTQPATHPYTTDGLQIDAWWDGAWIEIGECGLAARWLLPPGRWGLALGIGLDRLVMLRKGIPDIRLLRAADPRIASQMRDLEPYRAVSLMPPVRRDLSIVVDAPPDVEALGDRVRGALGGQAELVESVELVACTPYDALPPRARERLGIHCGQHNALVRVTLRALDRSLSHRECNALRDRIWQALIGA